MLVLNVNNSQKMPLWHFNSPYWRTRIQNALMLVFASDGVGVVISLWSSENSVPIPLMTPSLTFRLWSSENQIVGVGSRSGRINQSQCTFPRFVIGLVLLLLLPTPTIWFSLDHKWNVSDGVVSGVGRKWKRSDSSDSDSVALMTPLTTPIFDFH